MQVAGAVGKSTFLSYQSRSLKIIRTKPTSSQTNKRRLRLFPPLPRDLLAPLFAAANLSIPLVLLPAPDVLARPLALPNTAALRRSIRVRALRVELPFAGVAIRLQTSERVW